MPGAGAPAASCAERVGGTQAVVTTGWPKSHGIPCAMAFRLLRALSGVPGFLATIVAQLLARLDPSVGESGPHGLTVRNCAARLAARPRPSHPVPRK
jgi:hypothetical protein